MKKLKRIAATLLCFSMMMPSQTVYGTSFFSREKAERIESLEEVYEEVPSDDIIIENDDEISIGERDQNEADQRSNGKLRSEQGTVDINEEWDGNLAVYWNPEGEGAFTDKGEGTTSNASDSNGRRVADGSDHADGLTPDTPVLNLRTAISKAKNLSDHLDVEISDIKIYAMKPMVVPEGTSYTVFGKGVTVSAWEERDDQDDLIFLVKGGTLTLHGLILQPEDGAKNPEETPLIYVESGNVQLGEQVESYGSFVLDYRGKEEAGYSSNSNALASDSETDIYKDPVIELINTYDAASEYILDLYTAWDTESVTAVQALYSDSASVDEFMDNFQVVEKKQDKWKLLVEERVGGVLRDTTEVTEGEEATLSETTPSEIMNLLANIERNEDTTLTQKSLLAKRAARSGNEIYWNPGGPIDLGGGQVIPAGSDDNRTGLSPLFPVKTLEKAKLEATGGVIICMQHIDLSADATEVLGGSDPANYVIDGETSRGLTIRAWSELPSEFLVIPDGITVTMKNIILEGYSPTSYISGTTMIKCNGGQLILEDNVKTSTSNIQVNLSRMNQSADHPILVNNDNMDIQLHFSGINSDLSWRYQNVVEAGANLIALYGADEETAKAAAGLKLKDMIKLEKINSVIGENLPSEFAWELRPDEEHDDMILEPHILELYTEYYYDAIYLNGGPRGSDYYLGATCEYPVARFEKAKDILINEMGRSVTARAEADAEGKIAERDKIALPTIIYICGTVTVEDTQKWELPEFIDYDGVTVIPVEIRTHMEPWENPESGVGIHMIADPLIHVKGNWGNLTLGERILIRSVADDKNSSTIVVDQNGTLRLDKDAQLTGLNHVTGNRTEGTHVLVGKESLTSNNISTGAMIMETSWTGSINNRGVGLQAYGAGAAIIMNGGAIEKNHQASGSQYGGVYLGKDVQMLMDGGKIAENHSNINGAGVYMDAGSTFKMTRGLIEKNTVNKVITNVAASGAKGLGVYVSSGARFEMGVTQENPNHNACVIQDHQVDGVNQGVGIYISAGAIFKMYSGAVKNNKAKLTTSISNSTLPIAYGIGIFNAGDLEIKDGFISGNGIDRLTRYTMYTAGGGIYLGGTSQVMTGGRVSDNDIGKANTNQVRYFRGGGIAIDKPATLDGVVVENNIAIFGAGIAVYGVNDQKVEIKNSVILGNKTKLLENELDGSGGGIYNEGMLDIRGSVILENFAANGAGIYTAGARSMYVSDSWIGDNKASKNGGGVYISGSSDHYMVGSMVQGNEAVMGGGIYSSRTFAATNTEILENRATLGGGVYNTSNFYLNEWEIDVIEDPNRVNKSSLIDNLANKGGGLYNVGTAVLDISEPIQNLATGDEAQGNNIFINQINTSASRTDLTVTTLLQPENSQAAQTGVYNIYMDSEGSSSSTLRINPQEVTINGPDYIFLNTTNNYLQYFEIPLVDVSTLPVDLNMDNFTVGSIVVKPANLSILQTVIVKRDSTGWEYKNKTYSHLDCVKENYNYISGGQTPLRCRLGVYEYTTSGSTKKYNIVLFGEGVYLSSSGLDSNDGMTPGTPVATFEKAKAILETETGDRNENPDDPGFPPFIYICGAVNLTSVPTANHIWSIDPTEDRYNSESQYWFYEDFHGRTPEAVQVRRFTSFVNKPMVTVTNGTTLTIPQLTINGMSEAVITSDQNSYSPIIRLETGSELNLLGEAWIHNNYYRVIEASGAHIVLDGNQDQSNRQIDVSWGDGINLSSNSVMEMNNYSKVVVTAKTKYTSSNSASYYKNQGRYNRGVLVDRGSTLTMNDHSQITYTAFTGGTLFNEFVVGALVGTSNTTYPEAKLIMNDSSKITNFSMGIGLNVYNASVQMNPAADAEVISNTEISNCTYGIFGSGSAYNGVSLTMDGDSAIRDNVTAGVDLRANNSGTEAHSFNIHMKGNSLIAGNGSYGLYFSLFFTPVNIIMDKNSRILNNSSVGIYSTAKILSLEMNDDSRIGAADDGIQKMGISLGYTGTSAEHGDTTNRQKITMNGQSVIGGDQLNTANTGSKGNSDGGITTKKPINLEMSGTSKICFNGTQGSETPAINFDENVNYYGTSTIKLNRGTAISNNAGLSIKTIDFTSIVVPEGQPDKNIYHNFIVTDAAIENNGYRSRFSNHSTVRLIGTTVIGQPTTPAQEDSMEIGGKLYLDGTVTVGGLIYLKDSQKPITLQKGVTAAGSDPKYLLHLAEGFVGQVVVEPDGTEVTDASVYRDSFSNTKGEGIADGKRLNPRDVNIVLAGENNVYLSGRGNDDNNGTTPTTAVRTFKEARRLLRENHYEEGANIVICDVPGKPANTAVEVIAGDEDWSFDEGGLFTNSDNVSWYPKVIRHEQYGGVMIRLCKDSAIATGQPAAAEVIFKNITIDGGGRNEKVIANKSSSMEVLNVRKGYAELGEGAVLQNNQKIVDNNGYVIANMIAGVTVSSTGELKIDGGVIRKMLLKNASTSVSYPYAVALYNEGKVVMQRGSIEENLMESDIVWNSYVVRAAAVNAKTASFEMIGGSIINNEIAAGTRTNMQGGALAFMDESSGNIKGGEIKDNKGGRGSAIFYQSKQPLELEGGYIGQNQAVNYSVSIREYSPIFVQGNNFRLKGGGCDIEDPIYLRTTDDLITISGEIYQTTKRYHVYFNNSLAPNVFKKGSVVVQPDRDVVHDVTKYLINFVVYPTGGTDSYILDRGQSDTRLTATGVQENKCLILMKAVFIDSVGGQSNGNGNSPKTAVTTFARAKDLGEGTNKTLPEKDYFIIYVSGPVQPANGEVWTLENSAYMCRYTGFNVYKFNGTAVDGSGNYYYHQMIEPKGLLTLDQIKIYGRRSIDNQSYIGDSILQIQNGCKVIMNDGVILARNYNQGSYPTTNGMVPLGEQGGAVKVLKGGLMEINGGEITETAAAIGSAIYQEADSAASGIFGQVKLNKPVKIDGMIHLGGIDGGTQAYLNVSSEYKPLPTVDNLLNIRMDNATNGRPVVKYDTEPSALQINYYKLEDSVSAVYDFLKRSNDQTMLELQLRHVLYISGEGGNDNKDGSSPGEAVKTVTGLYQRIEELQLNKGVLVYVVTPIKITTEVNLINEVYQSNTAFFYKGSSYDSGSAELQPVKIDAQVLYKRYVQPSATTAAGFDIVTNDRSLFEVDGGKLRMEGIFMDGHSESSASNIDYLNAPAYNANAPLVTVINGGKLEAMVSRPAAIPENGSMPALDGKPTGCMFANNTNNRVKTKQIYVTDENVPIIEGSSAGIEILSYGTDISDVQLEGGEFRNLKLGTGVVGGSDVYQNGLLAAQTKVQFAGTVFLEGNGKETETSTSRFIGVSSYGIPFGNSFKVQMRDPYNTRAVVIYPTGGESADSEIGDFVLDETVSRFFSLKKRELERNVLELQVPPAVYVDGQNGSISNSGWNPKEPVESLETAYRKLSNVGGKVIYIVDTVEINRSTVLSATKYIESGQEKVTLMGSTDHIDIRRYIEPKASLNDTNYQVPSFTGTLIKVNAGADLTIRDHIYIDGHHSPKTQSQFPDTYKVENTSFAVAPLIVVAQGGRLGIYEGSELIDNNNTKTPAGGEVHVTGGAIQNNGILEISESKIEKNVAAKGAGVYQNGSMLIIDSPEKLQEQEIYLTTPNTGSDTTPVWGTDKILNTAVLLGENVKLDLNMDHAVAGRPVIRYNYNVGVDAQHVNYNLGTTVPASLFLVEAVSDDPLVTATNLLELQDWRILDVQVPKEIFLVIQNVSHAQAANGASDGMPLASPNYKIINNSEHKVKVSLAGFVNQTTESGITGHDLMNLVETREDALDLAAAENDLYLAIKRANTADAFAGLSETSLHQFDVDGAVLKEMGQLPSGQQAEFAFVAAASKKFIDHYNDEDFPISGINATEAYRIAHIRNLDEDTQVTSPNHARAKYKMTYRLELVPSRR